MKKISTLALFLFVIALMAATSCRKNDCKITRIEQVSLTADKDMTERGTFTATGGIQTTGTFIMKVELVGTDSFYCTNNLIASEGTFTTNMKCSATTNTGAWQIIGGTGKYSSLKGG